MCVRACVRVCACVCACVCVCFRLGFVGWFPPSGVSGQSAGWSALASRQRGASSRTRELHCGQKHPAVPASRVLESLWDKRGELLTTSSSISPVKHFKHVNYTNNINQLEWKCLCVIRFHFLSLSLCCETLFVYIDINTYTLYYSKLEKHHNTRQVYLYRTFHAQ